MARFSALEVDTKGLNQKVDWLVRDQVPYATSLALNELAKDTSRVQKLEAQWTFRRPTPFILRGFQVAKYANKKDPEAVLSGQGGRARIVSRYAESVKRTLEPQIEGGGRSARSSEHQLRQMGILKSNEWLVGASGAVNQFGNVPGPQYQSMLASFRRGGGEGRYNWYIAKISGRGRGVFRKQGKRGKPKLMFYVTTRRPRYRRRFDFHGIAQEHSDKWAEHFFQEAMDRALKTAR